MPNAFLNKKWLNFSKTQFLAKNGVRPSKTLLWTPNIKKNPAYKKRGLSEATVHAERILKQKMVKI